MTIDLATITKRIRADVKTARAAGEGRFAELPQDAKISVRIEHGSAVQIELIPEPNRTDKTWNNKGWGWEDAGTYNGEPARRPTELARAIGEQLAAMFRTHTSGAFWCNVRMDCATIGSVAPSHWAPNQD